MINLRHLQNLVYPRLLLLLAELACLQAESDVIHCVKMREDRVSGNANEATSMRVCAKAHQGKCRP